MCIRDRANGLSYLCDQIVQNVSGYVGEAEIASAVAVSQLQVIDTHQVKNRCMNIVHVNRLVDNLETEIVGCAINRATLNLSLIHI